MSWQRWQGGGSGSGEGAVVLHRFPLKHVTWHGRGDYFATVAPTGNTQVGGWCKFVLIPPCGMSAGWLALRVHVRSGWENCPCKLCIPCCCVCIAAAFPPHCCPTARYPPSSCRQAVLVHQLSRGASQNPFRKNRGRVVRVLFHPSKPFFFVATQQNVRSRGGRVGVHCRCWGAERVRRCNRIKAARTVVPQPGLCALAKHKAFD